MQPWGSTRQRWPPRFASAKQACLQFSDARQRGCNESMHARTRAFKKWTPARPSGDPSFLETSSAVLLMTARYHLLSSCRQDATV